MVRVIFLPTRFSDVCPIGSAARIVFPRKPPPHLWQQIMPGVNNELAKNVLELPENQLGDAAGSTESAAAAAAAAKPKEPVPVPTVELVDAPLIRAYNLLREPLTHLYIVMRRESEASAQRCYP